MKIAGVEIAPKTLGMIKDASWTLAGGIIAGGVMLCLKIVTGRLLGPTEFGKVTLFIALAQVILLILLFGIDTTILRAITLAKTHSEKKLQASSSLFVFICLSIIMGIVFF